MVPIIYTIDEFEERLAVLPIGTEDAQQLMDFVQRLDRTNKRQDQRLRVSATMLGYGMIEDAMMDEHYG